MKPIYLCFLLMCLVYGGCGGEKTIFVEHALHSSYPVVIRIGYIPVLAEPFIAIERWKNRSNFIGNPEFRVTMSDFLCDNIRALFPGRACVAPETLTDMLPLAPQSMNGYYTTDQLFQMADQLPGDPTDIRILVLEGRLTPAELPWCHKTTGCVIGFTTKSKDRRRVIAFFMPELATLLAGLTEKEWKLYVGGYEYAKVLAHEIGHLAGLVNNELAMVTPHIALLDVSSDNHCDNPRCTMHTYSGSRDVVAWEADRQKYGSIADATYDANCLQDIQAASTY